MVCIQYRTGTVFINIVLAAIKKKNLLMLINNVELHVKKINISIYISTKKGQPMVHVEGVVVLNKTENIYHGIHINYIFMKPYHLPSVCLLTNVSQVVCRVILNNRRFNKQ